MSGPLLFVVCVLLTSSQSCCSFCQVNEDDSFTIAAMLEDQLVQDCRTLHKLSGLFFENQEKPPQSLKVKYTIQIPYDSQCSSVCSCWEKACSRSSEECPENYCCIKQDFLWGRIPMYVQDSIYRELSMCPLVIGGLKEKQISINFNLTDVNIDCVESSFPCGWCHKSVLFTTDYELSSFGLDSTFTIVPSMTPLEKALSTLTAKLQGYAIKAQKLPWLIYHSEFAFGYSQPYNETHFTSSTILRHVSFFISYFLFHVILFMLIYKYRYRLYTKAYDYIKKNRINRSLFWSFVITTIITFACMITLSLIAGGLCLTLLQLILLGISLLFGIPHSFVTCFRMKKKPNYYFLCPVGICYTKSCCVCINKLTQILLFCFLYTLPHVLLFLITNFAVNFISRPLSYLIVLMYFALSSVFTWIANAIGLHLVTPHRLKSKTDRRRLMFAVCLVLACNTLNFSLWGFVEVYFYDKRAQATSLITLLPGMVVTVLGWYLSGDLIKLFDMFTLSNTPEEEKESEALENSDIELGNEDLKAYSLMKDESPRQRYSVKRLRRLVRAVQHPKSVIRESIIDLDRDSYVEIPSPTNIN